MGKIQSSNLFSKNYFWFKDNLLVFKQYCILSEYVNKPDSVLTLILNQSAETGAISVSANVMKKIDRITTRLTSIVGL